MKFIDLKILNILIEWGVGGGGGQQITHLV